MSKREGKQIQDGGTFLPNICKYFRSKAKLYDMVSFRNALWECQATSDGRSSDVETGDLKTSNSKISPLRGTDPLM